MKSRPTIVVIYAPTRRAAHALRDALCEAFEALDPPLAGIKETHWISVGEDSADEIKPRARPPGISKTTKKPSQRRSKMPAPEHSQTPASEDS